MIWFTADTHFGHANIIRHCRRPFANVEEMDRALIANINARVNPGDTLYHLGDFAFRGAKPAFYREQIRCRRLILILGNHDPQTSAGYPKPEFAAHFSEVHPLLRIKVAGAGASQVIILCQYAMRVWDRAHYGAWHLFGHRHGSLPDDPCARSWDVGVDHNDFRSLSLDEIAAVMDRRRFQPIDERRQQPPLGPRCSSAAACRSAPRIHTLRRRANHADRLPGQRTPGDRVAGDVPGPDAGLFAVEQPSRQSGRHPK